MLSIIVSVVVYCAFFLLLIDRYGQKDGEACQIIILFNGFVLVILLQNSLVGHFSFMCFTWIYSFIFFSYSTS